MSYIVDWLNDLSGEELGEVMAALRSRIVNGAFAAGNFPALSADADKIFVDSGKGPAAYAAMGHHHTLSEISDASEDGRDFLAAADFAAMRALLSLTTGFAPGDVPVLGAGGKLDVSILPALAITEPFVVASQSEMLALDAQKGDVAIRSDISKSFILSSNAPATLADWKELLAPAATVLSVAGLFGAITASALKAALSIGLADIVNMSADARTFNAAADYAAMRAALGLAIGANVQAHSAGLTTIAGLPPTNGYVLTGDGTGWKSAAPAVGVVPTMIVRDEKPSGTHGGSATTTTWVQRDLNTVAVNTISGASLASNQVTLPAGTYEVDISAPGYKLSSHKIRLYNVTDSAVALSGSTERTGTGIEVNTRSVIKGTFTISASKVFRVDHSAGFGQSSDGFGPAFFGGSSVEIYTIAEFKKVG